MRSLDSTCLIDERGRAAESVDMRARCSMHGRRETVSTSVVAFTRTADGALRTERPGPRLVILPFLSNTN